MWKFKEIREKKEATVTPTLSAEALDNKDENVNQWTLKHPNMKK